MGATGATGPAGPAGATGPAGPTGSAGASVTLNPLNPGDVSCPYGGTRFTVGASTAVACNGAPGPAGGGGGGGGSSDGGYGVPIVTFAGFTPATYAGNLGGRAGAHAICSSAFAGSHFCADWEYDQAGAPGPIPASQAWIDYGESDPDSRFFHYFGAQTSTCINWTNSSQSALYGGNLARGRAIDAVGAFVDTFIATGNGGCQNPKALACCFGGTTVRFRGFTTQTYAGNLGGRAGANALCHASFARSHFCSDWEYDQAAIPGPIPAAGAWIDYGESSATAAGSRFHHYFGAQTSTCINWTNSSQSALYGGNLARGRAIDPLGAFFDTFVATGNGGCQTPRALPCCE
jgi:hypothetical protein